MAFYDTNWYCNAGDQSTTGYYAVTKWATGATIAAGALRRQNAAPAVGSERVFVAIVGGTTHATTEPTWVITRGGKTTDNTVTWQECTGASAVNGDLTNTPTWAAAKAINSAVTLGAIIQRNNGASYWICSTAGSTGASEPAWANNTAGTTQTDSTVTWTCLGVVGNFTGGQAPHARIPNAAAVNWFAAGNTIYVGDNHAESQATAITITPALTTATMSRIICHNHSGSYPPTSADLRTTATISTTSNVNMTFNPTTGGIYIYGISFIAGVGASSVNSFLILGPTNALFYFDSCLFKIANTVASATPIQLNGTSAGIVIWNNCQVSFAAAANLIEAGVAVAFTWQNTGQVLASGSVVPTNLFGVVTGGRLSNIILEAIDLSQITTGLYNYNASQAMGNFLIKDCKLNASMTIPTPQAYGQTFQIVRSDSSGTGYKSARYQYEGAETTETSITRVGGASDPTGQAQSRKIVTTANSQWLRPFKAEPYAVWNPVTGANVTVTVYGTINAGVLPNNDDIWLEVEYLGSSLSPLGTMVTTTKASVLAANAAVASDGSTWNGGGSGAGWSPFKLTTTLSSPQPGMTGYIHARVRAAKPSVTYYIDPKIVLS
jgi:hypothetical protein